MKFISREEARSLSVKNPEIKELFSVGYNSTMILTNPKVMNDQKVRPNQYLVNDDFETNPQCFSAFFTQTIYKVIRCIYVKEGSRRRGLATEMINVFKNNLPSDNEKFLQIGVEATNDENFNNLDALYSNLGFKKYSLAIPHPGNKSFYDYFWSNKPFEVVQNPLNISQVGTKYL